MSHLTELQLSMYVDRALDPDALVLADDHLATCEDCQALLALHTNDQQLVRAALMMDEPAMAPDLGMPAFGTEDRETQGVRIPGFKRPVGLKEFAFANLLTGALFWLAQFSWKTLFGDMLLNSFAWLTEMVVPDFYDLSVNTILYFTLEGTAMIESYSGFIAAGILVLAISALAMMVRATKSAVSLCLLSALVLGMTTPETALALEHRKGDVVIESGETIDDTLFFTGESLVVDGDVKGDLVAMGRRIVVNGKVEGNLVTFAESISVSGTIGGTTISAGETVDFLDAEIKGDLWSAGEQVRLNKAVRISGNGMLAGERVMVDGQISRDLFAGADTVELSGQVGEDMTAYAANIKLTGEARVAGDLSVHSRDEDRLTQSAGASVGGEISFHYEDGEGRSQNRYTTIKFYVFQVLKLCAALAAGYGLLMLFPATRDVMLNGGVSGLATAGIGLVALVSLPMIAAILAITVVGLPIAMVGLFAWILGLYFSTVLVAWLIGSLLLDDGAEEESVFLPLLAGLGIVTVAVNLPWIGGFISLVLTVVGLGMIVQWLIRHYEVAQ